MSAVIQQTLMFIIQFIFGLYSFMVIVRIWVRTSNTQSYHPFLFGVAKLTNPIISPIKKILPDCGNIELASLLLLLSVIFMKLWLVSFISGHTPHFPGLLAWTFISVIENCLDAVFYVMIIMAILSWIPNAQPDLYDLLSQITAPLLIPIRRSLPLFGGLDLSPVALLLLIQVIEMLLIHPAMRASLMATFQ